MKRLPTTVDDLRGLRAARWIRESTTGQFDRYGPEAQAELQDGAVARLGLVDTSAEWRIAHSGRTVYRSPAMVAMLDAAAAGAFDVLLVGYVSRWQRNLRQTLNLLEDVLHPAGVAVWYLFESVDVLGLDTMHVEPTPAAVRRGLAEAFRADELVMVGARGIEPTHRRYRCRSRSRTYRATLVRSGRRLKDVPVNRPTRSRRASGQIRRCTLGREGQKPGSEHSSLRTVENLSY